MGAFRGVNLDAVTDGSGPMANSNLLAYRFRLLIPPHCGLKVGTLKTSVSWPRLRPEHGRRVIVRRCIWAALRP